MATRVACVLVLCHAATPRPSGAMVYDRGLNCNTARSPLRLISNAVPSASPNASLTHPHAAMSLDAATAGSLGLGLAYRQAPTHQSLAHAHARGHAFFRWNRARAPHFLTPLARVARSISPQCQPPNRKVAHRPIPQNDALRNVSPRPSAAYPSPVSLVTQGCRAREVIAASVTRPSVIQHQRRSPAGQNRLPDWHADPYRRYQQNRAVCGKGLMRERIPAPARACTMPGCQEPAQKPDHRA